MKPDPTKGIAGRSTKPGQESGSGPLGPESQNLSPWMLALVVIGPSVFFFIQNVWGFWPGIAVSTFVIVAGGLFILLRRKRSGNSSAAGTGSTGTSPHDY